MKIHTYYCKTAANTVLYTCFFLKHVRALGLSANKTQRTVGLCIVLDADRRVKSSLVACEGTNSVQDCHRDARYS